jgi:hypothetical protein
MYTASPLQQKRFNDFLMSLDFSYLCDTDELAALSTTIGETLGTLKKPQPISDPNGEPEFCATANIVFN